MIGIPAGTTGVTATVTTAATTATAQGSRPWSRGHSNPRNAATAAPSRPHARGSPSASPASAPTSVNAFHSTHTPTPAVQNPRRSSSGSSWDEAVATDSSIVTCACASFRGQPGRSRAFICTP